MGKWTAIVKNLPKALEEPDLQERIELAKVTVRDRRPAALAAQYLELRLRIDKLKDESKPLNTLLIALEQLLGDAYEGADIASLKLVDGSTVRTQADVSVSFDPTDPDAKDKFRQWGIEKGYERLMTLPTPTRDSLTKDMILGGEPAPPGLVVKGYTKVVLTKGKE